MDRRFRLQILLFLLLPLLTAPLTAQHNFDAEYAALAKKGGKLSDSARLHQLFDLDYEYDMATYPEWGTWEGRYERNGEWTDNSEEGIERRQKEEERPWGVINSIDRSKLSAQDQINYDLYRKGMERSQESRKFAGRYLPLSQLGGIHQELPTLFEQMPRRNLKDYQDILSRMRGVGRVIDNDIVLMRKGLAMGVTPPQVTLRDVPEQVLSIMPDDFEKSPVFKPFLSFPENVSVADQKKLYGQAERLYVDSVVPALRRLHTFLVQEYIPGARESIGMYTLPNGEAWYAFNVKGYTTTDLTPREIYDFGRREVVRIREEMQKVVKESGFDGTLEEYEDFLRNDPQFYYTDADELLRGYRDICKRTDPQLEKLFGRLPRLPYGVIPVPDFMAPSQTTAYYVGGSHEAGRAGYFYANTYNLGSRPKWEMEPLALHESVPGHHLQISIAQELEDLPRWRRDAGYTAFVEGWGLYAESLGEEMGFYTTPSTKYGQLSYQMWRAIRLVVDVGIHQFGWTREQAIEFFDQNSGKPLHDIEVEIDRYIVWPGQALAYKIGERKIRELREYARQELGEEFDIRAFHDQVLGSGALPLDLLEKRIREWVGKMKG